ncbi:MAG: FAD-binding protein [Deltaproteobacteria bacterium]|nr:FAD-binding protein [Deltaproteobacteria bacterium]
MAESETFDVAIVGGGLAGLSCACETAKAGLVTAVFERGAECGSKNVSGGRIYLGPLRRLLPEFWRDAPFERLVARESVSLASGAATTTIELRADELAKDAFASHTVLRAKLDKWLAEQAVAAGAMVLPESRVDRPIVTDGRVSGVVVGGEEIPAHVVVAADGALSLLAKAAGLNAGPKPERLALGVKEIVTLDPGRIEDRFGLEPGRGAARMLVGDFTKGLPGGGFLYTNKDSISVGAVVRLDPLSTGPSGPESHALLDALKAVPDVARLLSGGTTVEYSAHVVPEAPFERTALDAPPGLLPAGDAAGMVANYGFTVRGMDFAVASGILAGQAIVASREAPDRATAAREAYLRGLEGSFVLRDLAAARGVMTFLHNPRLYGPYPQAACAAATELFRVGPDGRPFAFKPALAEARRGLSAWRVFRDLWRARKL